MRIEWNQRTRVRDPLYSSDDLKMKHNFILQDYSRSISTTSSIDKKHNPYTKKLADPFSVRYSPNEKVIHSKPFQEPQNTFINGMNHIRHPKQIISLKSLLMQQSNLSIKFRLESIEEETCCII
jgi:hypothetical protein